MALLFAFEIECAELFYSVWLIILLLDTLVL